MPTEPRFSVHRFARGALVLALLTGQAAMGGSGSALSPRPALAQNTPLKGINVSPSMRPWNNPSAENPDSWWCKPGRCNNVSDGTVMVQNEIALLKQVHPFYLRLEFPWWSIEPTRGNYDWSRADYIVDATYRAGIQLAPVLVYTPDWAATGTNPPVGCNGGGTSRPGSAPQAADFQRFATAIASRYRRYVHYWEMWNEPDLTKYFNGSATDYANRVLVPGFNGVKAADPSLKVIFGGPSVGNSVAQGWIRSVLSAGGGGHFDIMAFHEYAGAGHPNSDAATISQMSGVAGHPVWLGEFGSAVNGGYAGAQTAALDEVLNFAAPPDAAQWWELRDDTVMGAPGVRCGENQRFGLYTAAYAPRRVLPNGDIWGDYVSHPGAAPCGFGCGPTSFGGAGNPPPIINAPPPARPGGPTAPGPAAAPGGAASAASASPAPSNSPSASPSPAVALLTSPRAGPPGTTPSSSPGGVIGAILGTGGAGTSGALLLLVLAGALVPLGGGSAAFLLWKRRGQTGSPPPG